MKKFATAGLVVTLLTSVAVLQAQDAPKFPTPQKEHKWLEQFAGEWESEGEMIPEPGKPPLKVTGAESARMLGGFWMISEGKNTCMGMTFTSLMTLGYDPDKKKYVGTWVDSVFNYMWKYEGTLDEAGKVLTLLAEGPCPMAPGKIGKFKDVMEIKSKDHRVLTSFMQGDDG